MPKGRRPLIPTYTLPGVLTMLGPSGPVRPLVLDSPHSGTDYPAEARRREP